MKLLSIVLVLMLSLATTLGQFRYDFEKPGSCPPPLPVQICSQSCFSDAQCSDIGKCCPTNCGGFICTKPVTKVEAVSREKPGSCPAEPKGRWVCSSTCSVDNHCRGTLKCCKNRCGALACQKPDVEVIESLDIPLVPVDDSYNNPRNPYSNPRDPSNYVYYSYN
ncbi:waprin-Phi1-like isoform X1 [Frieseomelitta varia]|uniref:waprin-Phi1-like isoform X1 n=1 Tax=Frieseomelitta varia TaxID=561572 RepID=UPI001CB67E3F|nr:waprin-Phi1-like isoform X1 [Frieseomelitta varia]XP_043522301.1 waprin-Phi1-like isoform X1 [Frieseomelitta varia]XP_043522302.1 waprin-Phi1-like isoform X1 [Frieseomelitta varia]